MTDEHKPLPVAGYTTQIDAKVALVNENKVLEERVLRAIDALMIGHLPVSTSPGTVNHAFADPRWLSIARTHIEQGFMALNRAVFQPLRVSLPEDED